VLTPAEVRAFALAKPAGTTELEAISTDEYAIAASRLDTDPRTRKYPYTPGEGDPAAVSFFDGAVDVDLLPTTTTKNPTTTTKKPKKAHANRHSS